MKMVMIAYNIAIDAEVMELLEGVGLNYYTKWAEVLGRGELSGHHLNSQVWPGINNVIMVAAEEERVQALLDGVREVRQRLGKEGVKAFIFPLEEIT